MSTPTIIREPAYCGEKVGYRCCNEPAAIQFRADGKRNWEFRCWPHWQRSAKSGEVVWL